MDGSTLFSGSVRAAMLFLALGSVSFTGCQDPSGGDRVIWHPIQDSLSVDPEEAILVRREAPSPRDPGLDAFARRLDARRTTAIIGVEDGDPELVLGRIVDAQFLDDGSFALLDQLAVVVRVYGLDGGHRYSIGGAGEGPGELDFPVALVTPGPGELWVVDGRRMIHRFREEQGELAFEDRFPLASFPRDACASDGSVVVHIPAYVYSGADEGDLEFPFPEVLYRMDAGGTGVHRFAVPYRSSHWGISDRMNRGLVACGAEGRVFLGFESMNRLDAYRDSSREPLWHASFEGLHVPPVRERMRPNGSHTLGIDVRNDPHFHRILSLSGGGGIPLVVQFARWTPRDELEGVETFVLNPRTGEGSYLGEDLPRILSLDPEHVLFLEEEPYPRVKVAKLGEG